LAVSYYGKLKIGAGEAAYLIDNQISNLNICRTNAFFGSFWLLSPPD
jgi:hypothetical protein